MVQRDTVVGWLEDAGLEFEDVPVDEEPDFAWAFSFRLPTFLTLVAHRDVEHTSILMQVTLAVSEEHQEALRDSDADDRDSFLHDLRIALLQQPVGYRIEFVDEAEVPIPATLTFALNILEEPVQRSGFFRRNHQVQSAALLAVEMLKKFTRFGQWQ